MRKKCTFTVDEQTAALINKAAKQNGLTQSAVARMLLNTINHLPLEELRETTPVPYILSLAKEERNA